MAQKVTGIFKKIHERVEKGLIALWTKIKDLGKHLLSKITGKNKKDKSDNEKYSPEKQQKIDQGLITFKEEENKHLKNNAITLEQAKDVAKKVKNKHSVFSKFEVIDGKDKWNYEYAASPATIIEGDEKGETNNKIPFKEEDYIKAKYIDGLWVAKVKKNYGRSCYYRV